MVSPLMGIWDVIAMQRKGMGRGVGPTMGTMTVRKITDGSFLNPLTVHMVANYAIGGAAAGVLFHGTVGCWLQVTIISFN